MTMAKFIKTMTKEDKAIFDRLKPTELPSPFKHLKSEGTVSLRYFYVISDRDYCFSFHCIAHFKEYLPAWENARYAVMASRAFAGFNSFELPTLLAQALP